MKLTEKQNQELFEIVKKYVESIEEVGKEEVKTIYNLQVGDTYCYIDSAGEIECPEWDNDRIDIYRRSAGNCFLTEEEAQNHLDYLNAKTDYLKFIREWNGDRVINWADGCQKKWLFSYNQANQTLHYDYTLHIRSLPDEWYILAKSNKDIREELTDKLGKDKVVLAITGEKL